MTHDTRAGTAEPRAAEPDTVRTEPVEGSSIGLVREVTSLPDGRRITFYTSGGFDG